MLLVASLSGCTGEEGEPSRRPGPECDDGRCASQHAIASLETAELKGDDLSVASGPNGAVLLIGNAWEAPYESPVPDASVLAAVLPSLAILGRWTGSYGLGEKLVVADVGGTEVVAVGARGAEKADLVGAVFLLEGVPRGTEDVEEIALGSVWGDDRLSGWGASFAVGEFAGQGPELAVLDHGYFYGTDRQVPGEVLVYPLPLDGLSVKADAARRVLGAAPYGRAVAAWDADGDGVDELIVDEADALARFPSPWTDDRVPDDADVRWTKPGGGSALEVLADLDGDGLDELAYGDHVADPDRAGAVWILRGGDLAGGSIGQVPDRIAGDEDLVALGTDVVAADLDADGASELVVGASDLGAGTGGRVLAFAPALGGVRDAGDATSVHGDRPGHSLGWSVAAADPDGDGASDVATCEGSGNGDVCWLLPGPTFASGP